MRIRRRPLFPLSSQALPLISPDPLSSTRNPSQLDSKRSEKEKPQDSVERAREEKVQQNDPEEEGFNLKIDPGKFSIGHGSEDGSLRQKKGWVSYADRTKCIEERKGYCMFGIPSPKQVKVLQEEDEKWSARDKGSRRNGNGNTNPLSAETVKLPSPSQVGRRHEGETAFPLKKRKGGYECSGETILEKDKKKTELQLKKATKKRDKEEEDKRHVAEKKRRRKSGALMEGSRCSRVNGRGWRCCQQTLVGYSLCEHHLGKGRLRSMSSLRSRSSAVTRPANYGEDNLEVLSFSLKQTEELILHKEAEEDEEVLIPTKKKRKKIGIVKARSIGSLLGQTQPHLMTTIIPPSNAAGTTSTVTNVIL